MLRTLLGIFCLLWSVNSLAQEPLFDAMSESLKSVPKLDLRLETRRNLVADKFTNIMGLQVGLNYDNVTKLGLSYNELRSQVFKSVYDNGEKVGDGRLRYWYIAPYCEYQFYKDKHFGFTILALVGGGSSYYRYKDANGVQHYTDKVFNISYEPYMIGQYTFLDYFTAGLGAGYRLCFSPDKFVRNNLTTLIYVVKLGIELDPIKNKILKVSSQS